MKRGGILHPEVNHLIASMGHTDHFTICDKGFPIDKDQNRIDLALTDDLPTVLDVLRLVHADFIIDRILVADEAEDVSSDFVAGLRHLRPAIRSDSVSGLRRLRPAIRIETVSHLELKHLSKQGRATIRTGDTIPYANVLVFSG